MAIDLKEEKVKRIIDKLIVLEKLEARDERLITDKHIKEYQALEKELKTLGYEYIGNGYCGEMDK